MTQMRYQYLSNKGIAWTKWFNTHTTDRNPIQYKAGKLALLNEYREV